MNHDPQSEVRLLANSYATGHKPKETFAQLVARANGNAHVGEVPVPRVAKQPKEHKLVKRAKDLTPQQLRLVLELYSAERVAVVCGGCTYAVKKLEDGSFSIVSLEADAHEYNVVGEQCTCEDSRFRKRECKHVKALRSIR